MKTAIAKDKPNRKIYLDILNIVAILAVLFMHHDFGVHYFRPDEKAWFFDLILKTLAYFCIPVFLMCTGSTLLGYKKKYGTKAYLKKRVIKILIPMVAWFVIVGVFRVFVFRNLEISANTPIDFINYIMSGGILDYYWYLFLIIGIYLAIPLLSPLSEEKNKGLLTYGIVAIFVFNMLMPNICRVIGINYKQDLLLSMSAYLLYPLLGYYISTYNIEKKKRIILYAMGMAGVTYQLITTTILSYDAQTATLTTLGYTQFATALYSAAIFCFVRNMKNKVINNEKIQRILKTLAGCSFGIYLLHYLVMQGENSILHINHSSWVWRFVLPFMTYVVCVGIILVLKKIPIVRKIVP